MLQLRRGGHLCCSNPPPHSRRPGIVWPQSFPPRKATHPWGRSIPQETLVQGKKTFLSFLISSPHSATDSHCDLGQLWSLQGDLQLYPQCVVWNMQMSSIISPPTPQCVAVNCNLPSYLTGWLGRNSAAFEKISNLGAKLKKQKRKKKSSWSCLRLQCSKKKDQWDRLQSTYNRSWLSRCILIHPWTSEVGVLLQIGMTETP